MRDVQLLHRDRRCLLNADVVDTCDLELRHRNSDRVATLDAIYCKIYSFLVQFKGVVYKNPHCAACNGVKMNDTSCLGSGTKGNHSGDLGKIFLIPIFQSLVFEKLCRKLRFQQVAASQECRAATTYYSCNVSCIRWPYFYF